MQDTFARVRTRPKGLTNQPLGLARCKGILYTTALSAVFLLEKGFCLYERYSIVVARTWQR